VRDDRDGEEIESLTGRLIDRFPGIPATSIHHVAAAAWAEVTKIPLGEVAADLAERAATESLTHYPVPPTTETAPDPTPPRSGSPPS